MELLQLLLFVGVVVLICWMWAQIDTWRGRWSHESDRADNLQLVVNDLTGQLRLMKSRAKLYHSMLDDPPQDTMLD